MFCIPRKKKKKNLFLRFQPRECLLLLCITFHIFRFFFFYIVSSSWTPHAYCIYYFYTSLDFPAKQMPASIIIPPQLFIYLTDIQLFYFFLVSSLESTPTVALQCGRPRRFLLLCLVFYFSFTTNKKSGNINA